ncbi:serine hydrolase [Rhodobacter lacus]|uniref:beta-lactamase n=1 Tax=Rhodobacter lacus TaxID=1641972 RepID=A0ABW5AEQ3_9RHOB
MFFDSDNDWAQRAARVVAELPARFAQDGLTVDNHGLVALREEGGGRLSGYAYRGDWRCYPCSLVKSFHLVHALGALEQGALTPHPELERALRDMILWSSNTATNYVIDLLTGTTGDTLLEEEALARWIAAREGLNRWFDRLGWPEMAGCNLTQKLMDDIRYGREAQFAATQGGYLNQLTPCATARLMAAIFGAALPLSPAAHLRAQALLARDPRDPEAANPNFQLSEYLGGHLPAGVRIWSKAGHNLWTGDPKASWFKHDMIRLEAPGQKPVIFVLMTQGERLASTVPDAFPRIGRHLFDALCGESA